MDKTKIAVDIFDKYAEEYQQKFMDVDLYGDSFDLFCTKQKKENATVLELACGPGNISKYLLSKRPDFKLFGIDLSPNMIKLAKQNNPTASFAIMDCKNIGQLTQKYDAIMCGFCLPYLSKEETIQLIDDAANLVQPNGLFYISTMEDDYSNSGFRKGSKGDEMYMHFYTADFLTKTLREKQFNILHLDRKVYQLEKGVDTTDLIIIAVR